MPVNPFCANIFIDSCAFDPKYEPESSSSQEIFRLYENGKINLIVAHSTMKEIEHPNTPVFVKREAFCKIYSLPTHLTPGEQILKENILDILTGNANRQRMMQDSTHIFEAHKYGGYFVTADDRIINKRTALRAICNAIILKPSELLQLIRNHKNPCQ